jgi:hypothetical protein
MKRCDRCKFWVKDREESLDGTCRRYPPVPFLQMVTSPITQQKGVMVLGYWCNTRPELWCGVYRGTLRRFIARVIGFLLGHTKAFMAKDTTNVEKEKEECLTKERPKNILTAVPSQKTSLN